MLIAPNNDPGSDAIFRVINALPKDRFRLLPSMRFAHFSELMKNAACMIGNSSAGVREAPFLGLPSLDIGSRQTNRGSSPSITAAEAFDRAAILDFIATQWGRPHGSHMAFCEGRAADRFVQVLRDPAFWARSLQKQFRDIADRPAPPGWLLRLYLGATRVIGLRAWKHLERRRLRGKEHPERWREKAADSMADRPPGTVVWMHAVGLGEVLALRGLIETLARARPHLTFLVTSSARASGEVFARNRPPNTIHQYLPLDVPWFRRRFLDHWRPALSVWAEQDLWPGLVFDADRRGIPLAMINARMNERAYRSRRRARALYADLYRRFALIGAQDAATAEHIRALAPGVAVQVTGSLKAACSALADSPDRAGLEAMLAERWIWCCAPSHPETRRWRSTPQPACARPDPRRS